MTQNFPLNYHIEIVFIYYERYAHFVALPDMKKVMRVPAGIPMALAATLPCGPLTAYNAVINVQSAINTAIKRTGKCTSLDPIL